MKRIVVKQMANKDDANWLSWLKAKNSVFDVWEAKLRPNSFNRLWRVFMTARVAIATVLVLLQAFILALGNITDIWSIGVCIAYLCATLAVRVWARPRPAGKTFDAQWVSTIGVDVIVFSLLNFLQSSGINYTPLFALPVLLASMLGPIMLAFGTAASVTLLLLANSWWSSVRNLGEFNAHFLQSGLSGSGFFLVALLANQLALRLAGEEELTKTSQSATRMQIRVNELVVEALADGLLVIDANGMVNSVNPACSRLLAMRDGDLPAVPFSLTLETAWKALAELSLLTFMKRAPQEADINLAYSANNARRIHVRTRLAASYGHEEENLCVMFLEDSREMEARVRTEKMAAMGRMSAAVAHEIRNPLAAISQANALLEEDLVDPAHLQLTTMVRQNAQRLARIVDEILNVSRPEAQISTSPTAMLMLDKTIVDIAAEWATQTGATRQLQICTGTSPAWVWFEPEHLRRLMVNLLDNALRYASPAPDSICISTQMMATGQARLDIWSNGPPLEITVQRHLFEPFFSSESRSSGLGLYICRELCERYDALIAYQRSWLAGVEGNDFSIMFSSVPLTRSSPSFDATRLEA